MELFSFPNEIKSIRLFSENIENDETVFYHGTSDLYSEQIEKFGLFPNHKPVTGFFYEIINVADNIFAFTHSNEAFSEFNKVYRDASQYYRDFTRISFSSASICAANYSIGQTSGGQGMRHLIQLHKEISILDYSKLEDCVIDISDVGQAYLKNLPNEVDKLRKSDGVVYAFKFEKNVIKNLSYDNHGIHSVLLSTSHVDPSKIIAKMIIPSEVELPQDHIDEGNNYTLKLSQVMNQTEFIRNVNSINLKKHRLHDMF